MKQELNFWVLGGDLRQGKLAQLLAEDTSTGRAPMASEPTTEPPLTRKVRVTVLGKFPLVTVAGVVWEPAGRMDTSREEAEGALGVAIVPVEQDGGALCDAMLGEGTPEHRSGQGAAGGEEYYTYNQSRNRRSGG